MDRRLELFRILIFKDSTVLQSVHELRSIIKGKLKYISCIRNFKSILNEHALVLFQCELNILHCDDA